jgi:small subunit ribosomal protein S16
MRVGKKKHPSYRVVVADARSPRDGRIIEAIGHYDPRPEPSVVKIDTERATYWLERGAQPTDQVRKLLEIARRGGEAAETPAPARKPVKATPAGSVQQPESEPEEVPGERGDQPTEGAPGGEVEVGS